MPGTVAATALLKTASGPQTALIQLKAATFLMGSNSAEGFAADGEGPVRPVELSAFGIGSRTVSNAEFADFVRATGYITEAEQAGWAFVFHLQVPPGRRPLHRPVSSDLPWWLAVQDACWQRPAGPGSSIKDRPDHPVVQVSWHDAMAYCGWAGAVLPTEAQWEYAARGGLDQTRYPWGDLLEPDGRPRCNIWQGGFPFEPAEGWLPDTVAVDCFAPNGYGLFNCSGNVWEWCADWFTSDYHRITDRRNPLQTRVSGLRAQRGGSFLCHASYCNRYRLAARGFNSPTTATSNASFRIATAPSAC